jgi:ferredoxin
LSTTIFYYTGTGNSLWASRAIASELGDTELISIKTVKNSIKDLKSDCVGIVFPVYIWGVPAPVRKFIVNFLREISAPYIFAMAVNGGQVANTLVQLKKIMSRSGLTLSGGFDIRMPSNYTPWGGPEPIEAQQEMFKNAKTKFSRIVSMIRAKETSPMEKGSLWQRLIFSGIIYNISFPQVPSMDKQFFSDDKCNKCGICQRVCPAANITVSNGKPVWNHQCEQCFACLQWCPKESIQYGQKTANHQRYHHPEVILKDILQ